MKVLNILVVSLMIISCSKDEVTPVEVDPIVATATIFAVSSEDGEQFVTGDKLGHASFAYASGVTSTTIRLSGMEPNTAHAMHLHQGTLALPGRHWNQGKFVAFCEVESMGRLWLRPFAGDVGNIQIDGEGNGEFTLQTELWSVGTGDETDILGTVLFIHHKSEDFANECDPNHKHDGMDHSNMKIAGGTVTLAPTYH